MPRFFAPITIQDLKAKIEKVMEEDSIREVIEDDLKVSFDFENFSSGRDFGPPGLTGYQTTNDGLTFCGMCAGGDWETPVFFIVYWDGKKLRGYVPTDGNPWNTTTKQAYGNDDEADLKNAKKRWPKLYKDCIEVEADDFDFEPELIRADIALRIQAKR